MPLGDGRNGAIDAEHLMIARHHLAGLARLAFVEQDEVLDDVEQPVMRQHAVQQTSASTLPLSLSSCRFHSAK